MSLTSKKYITMSAVVLMLCTLFFPHFAYAEFMQYSETSDVELVSEHIEDRMNICTTWLDDEMLRIDVADNETGEVSSLAIRLSDFIEGVTDTPYVLIQATDLDGNLSGAIHIDNPFYTPPYDLSAGYEEHADDEIPEYYEEYEEYENSDESYSVTDTDAMQQGLTPGGTGVVVDNVVTQNGIEFFTVYTEDGNVFFLVVDRYSSTDNVHLLNAVTEADLMALAERSGSNIPYTGAIPPIEELIPAPIPEEPIIPEPQEPEEPIQPDSNSNFLIIGIAVVAVGAIAYYLKIVKPKKDADYDEDYGEDGSEYDDTEDGGYANDFSEHEQPYESEDNER